MLLKKALISLLTLTPHLCFPDTMVLDWEDGQQYTLDYQGSEGTLSDAFGVKIRVSNIRYFPGERIVIFNTMGGDPDRPNTRHGASVLSYSQSTNEQTLQQDIPAAAIPALLGLSTVLAGSY